MMPYGPNRQTPKERALSKAERDRRIEKLQAEQERQLRKGLSDNLFDWIEDFEQDGPMKTQRESTFSR